MRRTFFAIASLGALAVATPALAQDEVSDTGGFSVSGNAAIVTLRGIGYLLQERPA